MQLAVTVTGELDPQRLRQAVSTVIARHPNLAARFHDQFGEPVQVLEADPVTAWQYAEPADTAGDVDDRLEQLCAAERRAVCDLAEQPTFRAALMRTGDEQHKLVLTIHHIVIDGWSLPILLQEIFAGYFGHRLPSPASYRNFVSWLAGQDHVAAKVVRRDVLAGFETPTLVGLLDAGRTPGHRVLPPACRDHPGTHRAGPGRSAPR